MKLRKYCFIVGYFIVHVRTTARKLQ